MRVSRAHLPEGPLTPIQRAMLSRVARDGSVDRLLPWEGRTVRSLVARALLRRARRPGLRGWVLTPRARRVLALVPARAGRAGTGHEH